MLRECLDTNVISTAILLLRIVLPLLSDSCEHILLLFSLFIKRLKVIAYRRATRSLTLTPLPFLAPPLRTVAGVARCLRRREADTGRTYQVDGSTRWSQHARAVQRRGGEKWATRRPKIRAERGMRLLILIPPFCIFRRQPAYTCLVNPFGT